MACYIGETETSADTVAFTAALETPWDSQSGQSPLCELCRMVNDRLTALHQGAVSFTRIGSAPTDTALGDVDYEGNPAWNPAGDFRTILAQCHSWISAMLNPETGFVFGGMANSSGYRWRYNNAATVKSTYDGAMSGLLTTLQEDWKPIILAMRAALQSLSGAEVESQPWTPVTVGFVLTPLISGDPSSQRDVVFASGGIDPATLFTSGPYEIATTGPPDNDWPVAFTGTGSVSTMLEEEFEVGFDIYDGGSIPGAPGAPTGATIQVIVSGPDGSSEGWYKAPAQETRTYRIKANTSVTAARAAMVGKTCDWDIEVSGHTPTFPIDATPAGGTLTFSTTTETTFGKVFDVDLEVPDSAITTGAHARDWHNGWGSGAGDGPKGCNVGIVLSNHQYDFCVDANGVYHDD